MEPNNPYQDPPYQTPMNRPAEVVPSGGVKMTFKQLWLSFEGRIPRKAYWIYGVVPLMVVNVVAAILAAPLRLGALIQLVFVLLIVLLTWSSLALAAKRWHDRDKSAWWILILFVPVIGGLWTFIENGCLRGTVGPNRFGGDATGLY